MTKELGKDELMQMAGTEIATATCETCSALVCKGWESVPSSFDLKNLQLIGTLKIEGAKECWEEYHPDGTNIWSPDAPIATAFHPYNLSDICKCKDCSRKFLRYTEYGGYYVDERIRELNPSLIV